MGERVFDDGSKGLNSNRWCCTQTCLECSYLETFLLVHSFGGLVEAVGVFMGYCMNPGGGLTRLSAP